MTPRPALGIFAPPRWMGVLLCAISIYCIARGLMLLWHPQSLLEHNDLFLSQWHSVQALGYGTVLFGITYSAVAFKPLSFWPVLGMVYISYAIHMGAILWGIYDGSFDPSFTLILFSYELNWLVPIAIVLHHLYRMQHYINADHALEV